MDASGGAPGIDAYPSAYEFCRTIRRYEKTNPGEQLGMSRDGTVMSEKEFNEKFGQTNTNWGWSKSWLVTVKDPENKTFKEYQDNMASSLNNYANRTHLADRGIAINSVDSLTPSGLTPFVDSIEESAKTPFLATARAYGDRAKNQQVSGLPSLREGDFDHLMTFLKSSVSPEFESDFKTEVTKRAFFQELCSILRKPVEELAIRVSSSYRDKEQESLLVDWLMTELRVRRKATPRTRLEAQELSLPQKEKLVTTGHVKGQPVETCKQQVQFKTPVTTHGISLPELQDLDYQITTNAALLEDELKENRNRAREQGKEEQFNEQVHGRFQKLLDGTTQLGRIEYLQRFQMMSKELPATGMAGADGNVGYGMEDVVVAQREHGVIAGQWVPVRITAVLDGHTKDTGQATGDNSAAIESGKALPRALVKRLSTMNREEFTRIGMVGACQAAIVDLDRQGDYRMGGSSLNCAAVIGKHLCIINTGDSRSVFINPNKAPSEENACIQLSEDAELLPEDNPDNKESRFNKMVHERGGFVAPHPRKPSQIRVKSIDTPEGDAGMSCVATIGDHHYNGVTSPKPFVTVYEEGELDPNGFLIQFCDGIPEVATNEQITRLVKRLCTEKPDISPENLAVSIRDHAFRAGSGDNLTVIVTPVKDLFENPTAESGTSNA
ncbi:protein phosphatase 2C family protein [Endozoicomonas gorgoniicola]|uniref:Protein phosphatase 2C family protein n=1 Tax=Endozoicomonas gorgoniicola TaxID=1234144 RepID=A0ABT3MPR0_9GAMM|nr:PP2C family serine/threonine-protein phosphatase [Endozoicomonas gorgoniicola]MCW7551358.1 protein phosphatase 2C family protein [Endozoicomonas gorgoniicola]